MDRKDVKKKLLEVLPEGAQIDDDALEQIAGGIRLDMSDEELRRKISALGLRGFAISKARLLDAKPNPGGGVIKH